MSNTFKTVAGDDKTCAHCGSIYSTKIFNAPFKDNDACNCVVCGEVLDKWRSTSIPTYTLKERGPGAPSEA